MNVLFLCTGNSCRSIIAEATFNALAPKDMKAMSAGSKPTGEVHPRSIALLKREGIPSEGFYSKSWDNLPTTPDIVITVCGNAAGETCPAYLGKVMRAHWGVDDPAKTTGTEEEGEAADGPGSPWWRSPMAAAPRAASRASKRGGAGTSSRWAAAVDAARAGAGEGWGGGGEVREEKERSHEGFWWRARFRPAHQATAGH